jgi:hypothetical protein
LSLLIEFLFVSSFIVPIKKAVLATICMNAVTAAIGYFLIPWIGILPQAFLGSEWAGFWGVVPVVAMLNAPIEYGVLCLIFKIAPSKRKFLIIIWANLLTACLPGVVPRFVGFLKH